MTVWRAMQMTSHSEAVLTIVAQEPQFQQHSRMDDPGTKKER